MEDIKILHQILNSLESIKSDIGDLKTNQNQIQQDIKEIEIRH